MQGSLEEVLEREAPVKTRGRGRPKLGVAGREVSLLPRHWEWLEQQPNGISAALRRLVEEASKADPGGEFARRTRDALCRFLSAMAGNRTNYEEACRALFAGDNERLSALVADWPMGVRDFVLYRAHEAARVELGSTEGQLAPSGVVAALLGRVWSYGDMEAVADLVAPEYTIHSDPGDPWEGQVLDHGHYKNRVSHLRQALPDVRFEVNEVLEHGERVAVRWSAEGTFWQDWLGLPATGKRVQMTGQTMYAFVGGVVAGHWQLVDRMGLVAQLQS